MKKTREYKIRVGLFSASLALYGISIATQLIPGLTFSIDKICMYLGTSILVLGLMFMDKNKDNNGSKDE